MDKEASDTVGLILRETVEYNKSIHSVTNKKPIDIIYASPIEFRQSIKGRIDTQ